jgi:hypothetical protein
MEPLECKTIICGLSLCLCLLESVEVCCPRMRVPMLEQEGSLAHLVLLQQQQLSARRTYL